MQLPLQITFLNMKTSEALEADIRERVEKLNKFCEEIMSCRVVVEAPPQHRRKGGLFRTRIDITVPGREIVVNREPDLHQAHKEVYVSVRDAFRAARRQLEDYTRGRRGQIKIHETAVSGMISELFPMMDYGRITTSDGDDIYFHRNSMVNKEFDSLEVGTKVRFVRTEGDEGPQASAVMV